MNCQPKDLALVVRDTYGLSGCNFIGTPVEVTESFTTAFFGRTAWYLKHQIRCQGCGAVLDAMYDADRQPIRGLPVGEPTATRIDTPDEVTA